MLPGSKHVNISGRLLRKLKPRARKLANSKSITKPCLMCTPKLLERPHKSERVGHQSTQSPEHNSSRSKITPFYDPPNRFRSPPRAGKLYLPPWGFTFRPGGATPFPFVSHTPNTQFRARGAVLQSFDRSNLCLKGLRPRLIFQNRQETII